MKALTIKEPWVSCILSYGKNIENRSWKLPEWIINVPVALHTSTKRESTTFASMGFYSYLPLGHVVAVARFTGCQQHLSRTYQDEPVSPWAMVNQYHWNIEVDHILDTPIPAKGKLGFWDISMKIENAIQEQLKNMPNKTIATFFTGGGGLDAGAKEAGYTPVFAIDNDPKALASYTTNFGNHAVCADIQDYDFTGIKANHLHASPSCKTSSNANTERGETQFDVNCAKAVCRGITQINPDTFSLENVVPYKNMKPINGKINAFNLITQHLVSSGYNVAYQTLNAADYGVPQTRKRLILLATKHGYPSFPQPTHSKPSQQKTLFELPDWVTWYEAIADLIPTLKETNLAPWQRKVIEEKSIRLPSLALIEKVGARSDRDLRFITEKHPVPTLKALDGRTWEQWVLKCFSCFYELSIECLARLQSFPQWYQFPKEKDVACSLIGNSVPPLLAQRIMETFTDAHYHN